METKQVYLTPHSREITETRLRLLNPEEGESSETLLEIACSSEEPYERWFGVEILGHKNEEVDLSRFQNKATVLFNHDRDKYIGVIEKAWLDKAVLRAQIRFAKTEKAQEILENIKAGILGKASIGYMVNEMVLVKTDNNMDTYRVTKWMPYEVSIVTVAADDTVGFGKSLNPPENSNERIKSVNPEENKTQQPVFDFEAERSKIKIEETQRVQEIAALCRDYERFGVEFDKVKDLPVSNVKSLILEKIKEADSTKPVIQVPGSPFEKKDIDRYNLGAAIRQQLNKTGGYETDLSQELASKLKRSPDGLLIPDEVVYRVLNNAVRTALTVAGATTGATLVGDQFRPDLFESTLKATLLSGQLGSIILSGLSMDQTIPIQTGDITAEYEGETDDAAESNPTFSNLVLSPKRIGAYTDYSRQLLIQGNPSIESLVLQELMFAVLKKADYGFFHGTGTGMPYGLFNTTGITSISLASVSYETTMKLIAAAKNQNAGSGLLRFVMSPLTEFRFNVTPITTSESTMIAKDGKLGPYEIKASTNITDGYVGFGDFSKTINAFWGGLDLFIDNVTQKKNEKVRVYGTMYHDSAVKNTDAFVISTDVPYLNVSE